MKKETATTKIKKYTKLIILNYLLKFIHLNDSDVEALKNYSGFNKIDIVYFVVNIYLLEIYKTQEHNNFLISFSQP